MIWHALRLALLAISRNAVRSFLTVLGVVIGVAAVITMVTVGNGATRAVSDQISSLGNNLLSVRPGQRIGAGDRSAARFKSSDIEAVALRIPGVAAVSGLEASNAPVVYGSNNWSTVIAGVEHGYFVARTLAPTSGRLFTDAEEKSGAPVCVLGETVRRELFGRAEPVGSRVRVKSFSCQVVGLLPGSAQAAMGQDQDDLLLMPLKTVQRRLTGSNEIDQIVLSTTDASVTDAVKEDLLKLLRERRHIGPNEEDDFSILDLRQIADAISSTTRIMTMLLAAVAAVSLLVGGIGIMNIMLVSVTERTREIGVRLAIGALERDVLMQFLIEAVTLSAVGGVIGVALALAASILLAHAMKVPFAFAPGVNLLSVLVAAAIGVGFGYFPALRAARLDPIEALRSE